MEKYHMVPEHTKILVGFSGGADSLCLMEVLRELAPCYGLSLYAVHVHHGIRGESADKDAEFAESYCRKNEIPCRIFHVSVPEEARKHKISVEEAGRNLRYRCFAEAGKAWDTDAVAVAHHQDDQAETVLFHMARGSGLMGAGGMRPVNENIIRPLLCVSKKEILAFLRERKLSWREDETNTDISYTRNCIRQEILPLMKARVNEGAAEHIASLALQLQETEAYLRTEEEKIWKRNVKEEQGYLLVSERLMEEPALFHQRLICRAVEYLANGRKDVTSEHIRSVVRLFEGTCGKRADLPGKLKAWREKGGVCIGVLPENQISEEDVQFLTVPGTFFFGKNRMDLCIKMPNPAKIPENKYTKWFDYDKIKNRLMLRKRSQGDIIAIDDAGHHKQLKRFMIDRKIPQHIRNSLWIVADGSSVVWLVGDRIGADYKVTEKTERILEITITGECEHE